VFLYFSHGEAKECAKNTISVRKFFSVDNSPVHNQKTKACIGLTNDKIKNYIMKSPVEFGGSKSIIKVSRILFPNKFPENKPFSHTKLTEEENLRLQQHLRMNAKWLLERNTLNVRSTSCYKFTPDKSQICYNCKKLEKNRRFMTAINVVYIYNFY
jgi:hypothetical protein